MTKIRYFPYKPRPYQVEVIKELTLGVKRGSVCLHAPTGFGKTPVILAALLPYVRKGLRILWAVRTGNETDRPLEEVKIIVEKEGLNIFALSYRGKKDMCLLARKYGELDYLEVSYLCSQKKRECPYYTNFLEDFDPSPFLEKGPLIYSDIFQISRKLKICPYFAQRALLNQADVLSLSYNYVIDSRLEWSIRRLFPYNKSVLVVDEAHNLQNIELNSDRITLGTFKRALKEAEDWDAPQIAELVAKAETIAEKLYKSLLEDEDTVYYPFDFFKREDLALLHRARALGETIRRDRLEEGKRPRSSLYHFASFWLNAIDLADIQGIAFIAEKEQGNLRLCIWDMRAAEILSKRWRVFPRCIFCSGTLEPINAFAETIGLKNYYSIKVPSIYSRENLKVYILEDLTTRGEELSEEMARKYVDSIKTFLEITKTNAAVFTASYRIQENLAHFGLREAIKKLGYELFEEERNITGQRARLLLEKFKEARRAVLLAPMGGRFAEGADFPGEELQAVYLVGIPFEKPTTKTRLYIEYYSKLYGEDKGRLYSYVIPALKKAAQALGRALRAPEDKAVFILGDYRYLKYLEILPDYVRKWYEKISIKNLLEIKVPW